MLAEEEGEFDDDDDEDNEAAVLVLDLLPVEVVALIVMKGMPFTPPTELLPFKLSRLGCGRKDNDKDKVRSRRT